MDKIIHPYDPESRELRPPMTVHPLWGIREAFVEGIERLEPRKGYAEILSEDLRRVEFVEDHRGETVYNTQNRQPVIADYLGPILDGFTPAKPLTPFDEWIGDEWITNRQNQFEYDLNQVDEVRRGKYTLMVDPLIAEAAVKRLQGLEAEAVELETQALAAREKIQADHPWPTPPQTSI